MSDCCEHESMESDMRLLSAALPYGDRRAAIAVLGLLLGEVFDGGTPSKTTLRDAIHLATTLVVTDVIAARNVP